MLKLTPMLKQYYKLKKQCQGAILFFRLGDFYEMFDKDAIIASKILGITLTARGKGTSHQVSMCGVPHHSAENYIVKLTKAGRKVAICEQVTLPNGQGIVDRQIIRIITPGTTISSNLLEEKSNNYACALIKLKDIYGFALADIGTGEFQTNETSDLNLLLEILFRLSPKEIIMPPELLIKLEHYFNEFKNIVLHQHIPNAGFLAYESLTIHFNVNNLHGFNLEDLKSSIEASGLLLNYLQETQKTRLIHLNQLKQYHWQKYLTLDQNSIRNLELLVATHDQTQQGSLLDIIDLTKTAMGGRLIKQWLLHPLLSVQRIKKRLDSVEYIIKFFDISALQKYLNQILDIERILGKIGLERANARDLISLKQSLEVITEIKILLKNRLNDIQQMAVANNLNLDLLIQIVKNLDNHQKIIDLLNRSIIDDPSIEITEGGIIEQGYSQELDELRKISKQGKDWLKDLEAREIKRTGINSLKVKFNQIFGYYIEVSKANLNNVPTDYIRKQTLVNAERFVIPELQEFEQKILSAEDKIKSLEYKLFLEIREQVAELIPDIQKTSKSIAVLDVLISFACVAIQNNYTKPQINNNTWIKIKQGRHPVIEKILKDKPYIPNDLYLDQETQQIIILTGPNMSGKSSYLRQTALIVLLAQIGSFVPAESAEISIVDRIFTRVGAMDNLARGQSTFMIEMQESASILNNATDRSLIIFDELGRGTSTYDGLAIAWAVIEYIHNKIKAKTLFATHYHELIDLAEKLHRAKNYSIAVAEHQGQIVFLYQVQAGGTPDSYGIEVAKLAGLPQPVIDRSQKILEQLESKNIATRRIRSLAG